jgi:hypothetical protein
MTTTGKYCKEKTTTGAPCRAYALADSAYCFAHDPQRRQERTQARRAGGYARHGRKLGKIAPAEPVTLGTIRDVCRLLETEVNCVLRLEISLSRAQTIARLAGAFVSAFQVGEIEQRLAALEAALLEKDK